MLGDMVWVNKTLAQLKYLFSLKLNNCVCFIQKLITLFSKE